MSDKYTEAFDSLRSDDDTKRRRTERILSVRSANSDEITVRAGTESAAKVRRQIFSGRNVAALMMAAVIFIGALFFWLFFGFNNGFKYADIYDLMKNVQMVNEDFIGFSLSNINAAKQKNQSFVSGVAYAETGADNSDTNSLIAVTEDFKAEEVRFKKPDIAEEITNEDINRFGAITKFFVMNNLLYIEITAHEELKTGEVEEVSYFTVGYNHAVFVVDLDSKNVYSVIDAFKDTELWDNERAKFVDYYAVMHFNLEHGLLTTNPGIIGAPQLTYFIDLHDNKLELKKVADTSAGEYIQDKYKNIYLLEDTYHRYPDMNHLYNFQYIDVLVCDDMNYEYFVSTDRSIYRALKSNIISEYGLQYYAGIESLQADKTWRPDFSSSDKILRNQLTYSTYSQGGEWILKDGRIVRIAFRSVVNCYNVDGKIIAHIKADDEEAILYLCDENQITADFKYIDINEGYDGYDKVVSYTTDSYIYRYNIQVGRTGHILYEHSDISGYAPKKYKITVTDGKIELVPIEPIYNGLEIVGEIIFLS